MYARGKRRTRYMDKTETRGQVNPRSGATGRGRGGALPKPPDLCPCPPAVMSGVEEILP